MMKYIFKLLTYSIVTMFVIFNNSIQANSIDEIPNNKLINIHILNDSTKWQQVIDYQLVDAPKGRFELGIELGILRTDVEYILRYNEFDYGNRGNIFYQTGGLQKHHSMINGFQFSHILNKKWWLQVGFRYGRSRWSDDILFDAYYNKSGEYIQPNGKIGYNLTLVSSGKISETQTNINVSITNAGGLEENDLIVSALTLEKSLNWIQIPLGIEYRFGEKQLNYIVKSGVSLNQITTTNYHVEGLIEGRNSQLLINTIKYQQSDAKQFLEGYLGVGVRYKLNENIIFHTNVNIRYSPAIQVYYIQVYTGLHFGMNYLF